MDVFSEFLAAFHSAVWPWGYLGVGLTFALRLLRVPAVQAFLPKRLRWDSWSPKTKVAVPFLLAALATLIPAAATKTLSIDTVQAAIQAGLMAVALHHGTKFLGSKMTEAALSKDPKYQPGYIRRSFSPLLPVDKKLLTKNLLRVVQ